MKTCNKCGEAKTYDQYVKNNQSADGYRADCKVCYKASRNPHSESVKAYMRDYAKNNRARMNAYDAKYRAKAGRRVLVNLMPNNAWGIMLAVYGARCMKCGSTGRLELDHIVPVSQGGQHGLWNAQVLCKSCNSSKQARSTEDYRPYPRLMDRVST